ncbi:unnamed protein product [Closterium sp. Yama58-4]|nr:unnamed protein product [Closterium sp. Yama58-4]
MIDEHDSGDYTCNHCSSKARLGKKQLGRPTHLSIYNFASAMADPFAQAVFRAYRDGLLASQLQAENTNPEPANTGASAHEQFYSGSAQFAAQFSAPYSAPAHDALQGGSSLHAALTQQLIQEAARHSAFTQQLTHDAIHGGGSQQNPTFTQQNPTFTQQQQPTFTQQQQQQQPTFSQQQQPTFTQQQQQPTFTQQHQTFTQQLTGGGVVHQEPLAAEDAPHGEAPLQGTQKEVTVKVEEGAGPDSGTGAGNRSPAVVSNGASASGVFSMLLDMQHQQQPLQTPLTPVPSVPPLAPLRPGDPKSPSAAAVASGFGKTGLQGQQARPANKYDAQKQRDWNNFSQYLARHQPPVAMIRATPRHVVEYMRYMDQFGRTRVHDLGCPLYGSSSVRESCVCPMKQAWGSLDALIGRLRAAFEENGGRPETNPFATRMDVDRCSNVLVCELLLDMWILSE